VRGLRGRVDVRRGACKEESAVLIRSEVMPTVRARMGLT